MLLGLGDRLSGELQRKGNPGPTRLSPKRRRPSPLLPAARIPAAVLAQEQELLKSKGTKGTKGNPAPERRKKASASKSVRVSGSLH